MEKLLRNFPNCSCVHFHPICISLDSQVPFLRRVLLWHTEDIAQTTCAGIIQKKCSGASSLNFSSAFPDTQQSLLREKHDYYCALYTTVKRKKIPKHQ